MLSLLSNYLHQFVEFLVPSLCVCCFKPGKQICDDCFSKIEFMTGPHCLVCGRSLFSRTVCRYCELNPPTFDKVRSATFYLPPVIDVVHQFKYHDQFGLQTILGDLMADRYESLFGHEMYDLMLPIPLAPKRERERGYNQATLLADQLSLRLKMARCSHTLLRVKETRPQARLGKIDRMSNVNGAFLVKNRAVSGKKVLLIDDVLTTGATLNAAASALKQAGADQVSAYTFARAF